MRGEWFENPRLQKISSLNQKLLSLSPCVWFEIPRLDIWRAPRFLVVRF